MAANAEVIISPEVSRQDLNKSMKMIAKAMKQTAKKSGDYFSNALKKSGADAGKKFSKAFKSKLGLAAIATSIAGAVFSGFNIATQQVAQTESTMGALFGEHDAITTRSFARGQGFTDEEISAFNSRVNRAGGDDQTGRDFIVDTSEFIAQARAGENFLLDNFKNFNGSDQFNAVISSLAGRDADDINKFLADIGWAGDSGIIFNMLNELGGRTGNEAFKFLNAITEQDKINAENLKKEAELEKKFSEISRNANINVKSGLLENIGDDELSAYQEGLELRAKAEITAVKNYAENQKIVLAGEKAKQELDQIMLDFFKWIMQIKEPIESSFRFIASWFKTPSEEKQKQLLDDSIEAQKTQVEEQLKSQGYSSNYKGRTG